MQELITRRNNVKISGNGKRTLLFAHGFGCDQNMWRLVTPAFAHDYKIVLFDYVGCGQSDTLAYNPQRYAAISGYAQDIREICHELQLTDVVLVAHSVSAMIGTVTAIENPGIFSALICIGPSACYVNQGDYFGGFEKKDLEQMLEGMDSNYMGWANFLAPMVMKNGDRPELSLELEQSFCSTDPVITRRFAEVTFFSDNRDDIKKIDIPTLILQCSDDAIAPESAGRFIADKVSGSQFVQLQATGHCPHLSHPDETISEMRKFLDLHFPA